MGNWLKDFRFAIRVLLRKPAFAATAVISLALGIGANTTIFSIVNELFLNSLPVEQLDRLVAVYSTDVKNPGWSPLSHLNWRDIREQNTVFSEFTGYDWTPVSVRLGEGEAFFVFGQLVAGNYFETLGVKAAFGRLFLPEEDETPDRYPVVVLGSRLWEERLGGDPNIIGETIRVNGQPFTVIGVTPAEFAGTDTGIRPGLWIPMAMNRTIKPNFNWYEERRGLFVQTLARLKPGVSIEEAQANLKTIATRLEQDYPNENKGRAVEVIPLREATINPGARGGIVAATSMLFVVVGLVLLIACANVANLLLGRAAERRREIALRLSIGAGRGQLLRQLLTESLLIALAGASLGLLLAQLARRALLNFLPSLPIPIALNIELAIDWRVLLFTFGLAILTGVIFGLAPSLQASKVNLVDALRDQGEALLGRAGGLSTRNLLVVGQVALCVVALAGTALFVRSLREAQNIDPGFEAEKLAAVSFDMGLQGYSQPRGEDFLRELTERLRSLPGVASAGYGQAGPFQGTIFRSVLLEGQDQEQDRTFVQVNGVGPSYLGTMGIPVLSGRGIQETDREDSIRVVVVNETLAERFWPGQDPLGKRFTFFNDPGPVEVVGVARDAKYNALGEDPQPYVYEPLAQRYGGGVTILARTQGDPAPALALMQSEIRQMDPTLPLVGGMTAREMIDGALWAPRFGAYLLAVFGFTALALASVGIYGVVLFAVHRRTREIGIRMALGASRKSVLSLVLTQGMIPVGIGLALGIAIALGATRLIGNLLFVSATDPTAFAATILILIVIALAATWIPARRATAIDPIRVLRFE